MSTHPVGATWEAVSDRGIRGRIWLAEKTKYMEIWKWCSTYVGDGSYLEGSWNVSYGGCKNEMLLLNKDYSMPRFRRIK